MAIALEEEFKVCCNSNNLEKNNNQIQVIKNFS